MTPNDTTLGGPARAFPTTRWSELASRDPAALVQAYWKPAYVYIRLAWRKSNEDAKDLTQAFFTHLLQNGALLRLRPGGGSFRGYLRQALKNFLIDADRAAAVRRPVETPFRLEGDPETLEAPDGSPDRAFDREWLAGLLDAAVDRLRQELLAAGKEAYFNVFQGYLLDPAAAPGPSVPTAHGAVTLPTYAAIAGRFGLGETDVRNYLNACRARLRDLVRAGVRETVETEAEADEELRTLLAR